MKHLLTIVTTLLIVVLGAKNYLLNQTKTQLTIANTELIEEKEQLIITNEELAIIIFKPVTPKKIYVLGCKGQSAAILVYSNGNSRLTEGRTQLLKLERRLPEDLPVEFYQPPECRSKGT